jgi:PAS domain S-box-containing protein
MERALARALRRERVLGAMHEALLGASDEMVMLREVCRVLVAECGRPLVWVGLAAHDARRSIRPVARAGQDDGFVDQLDMVWADAERGHGHTGVAVRTGATCAVQRYAREAAYAPWLGMVRARGFAGGISLALCIEGAVIGALTVYAREPDAFDAAEIELLEEVAGRAARASALCRASAARRRAEARMAEVLDDLGVMAWSNDLVEGRLTYVNAAARRVLGYTEETMPAALLRRDMIHPDDRARLERDLAACLVEGRIEFELRYLRPDGGVGWGHCILRAVRDGSGRVVARDGIAIDVTERRAAAEALRALNAELEQRVAERTAELTALYDEAPCGYHTLDMNGVITRVNATELRWLGYAREEVLGRKVVDFLSPQSAAASRLDLGRMSADTALHRWEGVEREFQRRDGSTFWALVTGALVRDAEGRIVRGRSALVDITERKHAEARLREQEVRLREALAEARLANEALSLAGRAKDEFLASMSHELRTPLNGILGLAEILMEGIYGPVNARQSSALARVQESGQHLLALINDILDLAKVEAGKLTLDVTPVAVEELVRGCVRMIADGAHRKRLRVSTEVTFRGGPVLLDVRRMKQALVNLLANAVKFTPAGGALGITAAGEAGEALSIAVWDTGVGIAAGDLERLFQSFVQLDSSLAREHNGSGLGLALVRRFVELHGGRVRVESEPGQGSRFTVTVPLRPPAVAPPATPSRPAPAFAAHRAEDGRLVLVAEDDEANAAFAGEALRAGGFRALRAKDGAEAVALARAHRPALILMDVQMPGMDGLTAIRALRAEPDRALAAVPILALTALAMPGDRERCLAAGADDYVAKPVGAAQLVAAIEALLRA